MGVQISTLLLDVLAANPSMYEGLQNATLVQNINAVDTLANTLQILNPALELLYIPEVGCMPGFMCLGSFSDSGATGCAGIAGEKPLLHS